MVGDWNTVLENNLEKLGGAAQHANKYYQNYIYGIINDYIRLCYNYRLARGEERMTPTLIRNTKLFPGWTSFDYLVNFPVCTTIIALATDITQIIAT